MKNLKRLALWLFSVSLVAVIWADPVSPWKEYKNPLLGIRLTVKTAWSEIFIKETKDTGSVTFRISSSPYVSVTISRQKADVPFDVWVSSEGLHQLYEPGYKRRPHVEFAGRRSVQIIGQTKDTPVRKEESYMFSNPPYVDQISFDAPEDFWPNAEPDFAAVRESIHWVR